MTDAGDRVPCQSAPGVGVIVLDDPDIGRHPGPFPTLSGRHGGLPLRVLNGPLFAVNIRTAKRRPSHESAILQIDLRTAIFSRFVALRETSGAC